MLTILKSKNKKVLIAIDEANNYDELKYFISDYQQLLRNKFPVYLLMTGLYENISKLQNNFNYISLSRTKNFLTTIRFKKYVLWLSKIFKYIFRKKG